jgi:hypothetical protein
MKKKIISFVLSLGCVLNLCAQNLVPNPSFEDTVACPQTLSHSSYATGWSSFRATPDFFHSCSAASSFPGAGVPVNRLGYQYARTGEGYGGFYAFQTLGTYREMLGIQLSFPLVVGQQYFVKLYFNRAVNLDSTVLTGLSCNKLGIRLSTTAFSSLNPAPYDGSSQFYTDTIVTDSTGWFLLTGSFISDSAYSYLSIGNFFPDSMVSYASESSAYKAYYYVDDICLTTNLLFCNDFTKGINEEEQSSFFSIYPNPAHGKFTMQFRESVKGSLQIFDLTGRVVHKQPLSYNQSSYISSSFSPGVYFVKVTCPAAGGTSGQREEVHKLIIE